MMYTLNIDAYTLSLLETDRLERELEDIKQKLASGGNFYDMELLVYQHREISHLINLINKSK
jgi:hypothetical protein